MSTDHPSKAQEPVMASPGSQGSGVPASGSRCSRRPTRGWVNSRFPLRGSLKGDIGPCNTRVTYLVIIF